ncbi:MAG: hypothetical protein GTO55_00990 [Armatimonadetes bacterium]|nr:hypothetical protein [Armatimonadota bacterium]NIM22859.1 hypothetical protein [Armatimonadota bacterium]NIM66725.1 hypothetical protein [Armatimonadota bacterium]NIM75282.1 hypothetical protein [Armatimonadota bacterium]NIN04922.1 hypothetical protein [Armatimonadota bacterium]
MSQQGNYTELLEILQAAIQREVMAARLYEEGAAKANDDKARELLQRLAKEERHHRDLLQAQYEELAGGAFY